MIYKLTIGDYWDDGHGKYKLMYVDCNIEDPKAINDAVLSVGKMIGLCIYNDICCEYEESWINRENAARLLEHGIDVAELAEYDEEDRYYMHYEAMVHLYMAYAEIHFPELEYEIVKDQATSLGDQFGYGLFY